MYARVTTYQGTSDQQQAQLEEGMRHTRENIVPQVLKMDGCQGVMGLLDRQSGKALSVTLWESEEAMRASEEAAKRYRQESAEASSETVEDVERYEVLFLEVQG